MPWMVCACHKRFYAPPSRMTEATCDDCARPATIILPPDPIGFMEAWEGYGNLPRSGEDA